ncbi:hypothetical protein ACQU0X_05455 [Pseudovibrio ascidiaceicola]|uniref:hypothetical protein n=1 Tax=Pseudovibrio ascidiaceicola TaxID=285279 RepID=UPI003D36A0D7
MRQLLCASIGSDHIHDANKGVSSDLQANSNTHPSLQISLPKSENSGLGLLIFRRRTSLPSAHHTNDRT